MLSFVDKTGQHVHSITSAGRGIGPVAVSQTANLIAYAEVTLEPLIHILRYPECSVTLSLKGKARDALAGTWDRLCWFISLQEMLSLST